MATIYRKTRKGQTEIETRALKLAPRLRSLLILVDGRRTDDELVHMLPAAGPQSLAALATEGLIEVIGVTTSVPPVAQREVAPAAPLPAPAAPVRSLEQGKRELVRALTDQVGPMSEALAMRIERAASAGDLAPLIEAAANMVGNVRGRDAAATFRQRFGSPS